MSSIHELKVQSREMLMTREPKSRAQGWVQGDLEWIQVRLRL